jgi:L-lactate dehydrogenase complex protein LldG
VVSANPVSAVGALVDALTENRCTVHGPMDADEGAVRVVQLARERAAGASIALPLRDPAVVWLELESRLGAADARLLHPDDPGWRDGLPTAGVGVTGCVVAVAATGNFAIAAGPGCPRATSLVPPAHVCVIRTGDVVATFAEAIARVAAAPLPSALSWIGGPSRTSDLEMRTTFGVHGPKTVDTVLVEG